ncbi:MAG: valine--tRNA ligase [Deltaproteobacteria bacterium]|nr:valine--tRNA ligase [Deltaproteobacteria bacterium]
MEEKESLYEHSRYEQKWWDFWTKGGWFKAKTNSGKKNYTILIPPPNVTDRLHMGHGLNNTIQDILIRWKRMQGYNCLWLPGTDHAGIATQMMVEKALAKEGLSRKELGRTKFFQRCVEWKEKNGGIIINQLKKLGASCDWDREAYTMDEHLSRAVRRIFVNLFNDGLIYRGERLVNWDPALETAISDDEVNMEEVKGKLWHIRYPLKDEEGHIVIATTRPETMLGDTAVAVNPDDERYQQLIGKQVVIPFVNRVVPIVADHHVKPEFGTGCVKITPAHDPNDFEIAKRHQLPLINIFDEKACLNDVSPQEWRGLDRFVARKKILAALEEKSLLEKEEPYRYIMPFSDRSKVAIEPRLSKQWYVRMKELAGPAIDDVRNGTIRLFPKLWDKTYFHWMEHIQDWCISRQLWWGHRIPIWYCADCEDVTTGVDDPKTCRSCGGSKLKQDEDVLDTWFSSWLWPLSPFGWPEETEELRTFFPSNVLVTGAEIIFLWVARMIMVSHYTRQQAPFKDVYFNSIICDKNGRKFSKTLGNGIDPLETISEYGADATRFTCVVLAPLGGRVRMESSDFANGYRFVNKLWNASRFLNQNLGSIRKINDFREEDLDLPSRWLIHQLRETSFKINHCLEHYWLHEASAALYQFIWHAFCDWGLETAKPSLGKEKADIHLIASVLIYVFEGLLRLAAPFIPFVSEEIWHSLPAHPRWERPTSLVIAKFPQAEEIPQFSEDSEKWEQVKAVVTGVRSLRTQAAISPKEELDAFLTCDDEVWALIHPCRHWIKQLANVKDLQKTATGKTPHQSLVTTGKGWSLHVPVGTLLDVEKEKQRLERELKRIGNIVKGLEQKITDKNFLARAPQDVIESSQGQLENMRAQAHTLLENIKTLS